MSEEKYKMFVWHGVLRDYTSGMIVVHARSLDEAYMVAIKEKQKDGCYAPLEEIFNEKPDEIIELEGVAWVYGGG